MRPFSNLARVVYQRTYSRTDTGRPERFEETVERVIGGNVRGHNVSENEIKRLRYFLTERKAGPAGRGWWFSGSPVHSRLGGAGLVNCWFFTSDDWENFVVATDLLMLGGGVGLSVERHFTERLPRIRKGVCIVHQAANDADFIVPDTREGWVELVRRTLESFFVTGRSFSYSTVCLRPYGDPIKGFGGKASGPRPLVRLIEKLCALLLSREGLKVRPIDAADIICSIGEMVVSGNVRRSAILILGDAWDREYLKAKRWDLGPIPTHRSMANFSVVAEDAEHDLRPMFWETYKNGEPFGLVNRANIQAFGRMGERKKDTAIGVNPCAEACLEDGEPCNLQELNVRALTVDEFVEAAVLMHRWGKRVTMEAYHWDKVSEVIKRNRRIGTGITGCLAAPHIFTPEVLDRAYAAIQEENIRYSKELGISPSIRTTVIKPSGSQAKMMDADAEGIHPGFSRYMIQRIRVASNDVIVPRLQAAGHYMEPEMRSDGSKNPDTMVVDFYVHTPEHVPVADEGYDTWKQLDNVLMAQKHWADQSVSVTAYYQENDLPRLKSWVSDHLQDLKTVSFLRHAGHGFPQAPKEPITKEQYENLSSRVKPLDVQDLEGPSGEISGLECEGGACPVR